MGFPCGSAVKESTCNVGDLGSIPGLGRFLGEGQYPLQYSGLENCMDCMQVHGVAKSWTQLSEFHKKKIREALNLFVVLRSMFQVSPGALSLPYYQ